MLHKMLQNVLILSHFPFRQMTQFFKQLMKDKKTLDKETQNPRYSSQTILPLFNRIVVKKLSGSMEAIASNLVENAD